MSEAGFLSAIRADPNDEATRLIYADYLEERGDVRGEFLRLDSRLAEPGLEYAKFDQLRERLKQLRAALYPKHQKWLAAVDVPDRFTVFLSKEDCDHLRAQGQVGKPLRFIAFSRFGQFKPRPGIPVYAIRVHRKKLYVIGRMRVAGCTSREAYLPDHPDDAPLFRLWEEVVLLGDHGTPIQPDTVVSPEVLHRFRYRAGNNEYPLKHVKYGEVTHSFWLGGVTRITKATAQDLDFLLTGKVARHLSAQAPAP
jgi:uncharacterized protein (TIGR02996 family)